MPSNLFVDFNISQSDNAREFKFTETTGAYNASTNPGGYGAPNDATTDATSCILKVTPPGGTEASLDLLVLSSLYPTTDRTVEFSIKSQDIGLAVDAQFVDGAWTFQYEIESPNEASTVINTQTILISGMARCCVFGMLADVDLCDCDGTDLARALEAYTYYRAAIACAACGDSSKFASILSIIDKYCNKQCC